MATQQQKKKLSMVKPTTGAAAPAPAAASKHSPVGATTTIDNKPKTAEEKAYDAAIAQYQDKVKAIMEQLVKVRDTMEEKEKRRQTLQRDVFNARKELRTLDAQIKGKLGQRQEVVDKLQGIRSNMEDAKKRAYEKRDELHRTLESFESALGSSYHRPAPSNAAATTALAGEEKRTTTATERENLRMTSRVESLLKAFEMKLVTATHNPADEKALVTKLSKLRNIKAQLVEELNEELYNPTTGTVLAALPESRDALSAMAAALDGEIKEIREKKPKFFEIIEKACEGMEENKQGLVELVQQKDKLVEEAKKQVIALNDERDRQAEKRYKVYKAGQERIRKELEQESAQRKAKIIADKKQREEDEKAALEKLPHAEELELVNRLISYTKTLAPNSFLGELATSQAVLSAVASTSGAAAAPKHSNKKVMVSAPPVAIEEEGSLVGLQLVQKKKGGEEVPPKKKGKQPPAEKPVVVAEVKKEEPAAAPAAVKKEKAPKKEVAAADPIKHRMQSLAEFESVSIKPPMTVGEVATAMSELIKKKSHYETLQDAARKAIQAKIDAAKDQDQ